MYKRQLGYWVVAVAEVLAPEPGIYAIDKDVELVESTCKKTFETSFCRMMIGRDFGNEFAEVNIAQGPFAATTAGNVKVISAAIAFSAVLELNSIPISIFRVVV